ncbi:MAG: hypothetical protein ACC619_01250 [Paracoccaceae bacterium]
MVKKRNAFIAGSTVLVVLAAGLYMQFGNAIASRFTKAIPAITAAPAGDDAQALDAQTLAALPAPPPEMVLPGDFLPAEIPATSRVAAVTLSLNDAGLSEWRAPLLFQTACEPSLSALPAPGAMVRLRLEAPCYRNQRILVEHAGLEFADATGADGSYAVNIPALSEFQQYSVTFADGNSVIAKTLSLSLAGYDRVAISWQGGPGLHINALEFGAGFGDVGHVWENAAGQAGAENGRGGYLLQLGNPGVANPRLAEIYTFPPERAGAGGTVRLIVEAEVTGANCGQYISGRSVQMSAENGLSGTNIALTMPDCEAGGGFLVLNNLFLDMNIAAN